MTLSTNLKSALIMVAAMSIFATGDTITKYVSASISVAQIMFVRGVLATSLIFLIAWWQGQLRDLSIVRHPAVLARACCELGATTSFLTALSHMPLANVSAVLQALPLGVTMGAALFMGEKVRWRRWLAIAIGFSGVLIIVRPGFEGFNAYALLAMVSVVFSAARDLVTQRIPRHAPTMLVSGVTSLFVSIAGLALILPFGGWKPIGFTTGSLLVCAAFVLMAGYNAIIMATRMGDVSFVAPFRYTSLIVAMALGYLVFSEVPDLPMIIGSITIVGSGLYAFYRERVVARSKRPATQSTGPGMGPDGV